MRPKRLVYVSCDSATLARDLKYLCSQGYELKCGRAFDNFPMGGHVETVCLLSKLNAKQHIEVDIHMDELDPVSYTHLDVYKRQVWKLTRLDQQSVINGIGKRRKILPEES